MLEERDELEQEPDLLEMVDEGGNTIVMQVLDYFFYNGNEYAIISEYHEDEEDAPEDVSCYVVEVRPYTDENGEEMEEFAVVEDEAMEKRLMDIAMTRLQSDEEAD